MLGACGGPTSVTTVDLGDSYQNLEDVKKVTIQTNDGKTYEFSGIKIYRVEEEFIYAHCWGIKDHRLESHKFPKKDIVIEIVQFQDEDKALFRDLLIRFGLFWAMVALWS